VGGCWWGCGCGDCFSGRGVWAVEDLVSFFAIGRVLFLVDVV
jgi:hypothetical protein